MNGAPGGGGGTDLGWGHIPPPPCPHSYDEIFTSWFLYIGISLDWYKEWTYLQTIYQYNKCESKQFELIFTGWIMYTDLCLDFVLQKKLDVFINNLPI